jgi:hypothetical protein
MHYKNLNKIYNKNCLRYKHSFQKYVYGQRQINNFKYFYKRFSLKNEKRFILILYIIIIIIPSLTKKKIFSKGECTSAYTHTLLTYSQLKLYNIF